jgi:hypothetical protein
MSTIDDLKIRDFMKLSEEEQLKLILEVRERRKRIPIKKVKVKKVKQKTEKLISKLSDSQLLELLAQMGARK